MTEGRKRAHEHRPVLRPVALAEDRRDPVEQHLEEFLREDEGEGAKHGAGSTRHAAQDHHEHDRPVLPAHEARHDVVGVVRVERAREPRIAPAMTKAARR